MRERYGIPGILMPLVWKAVSTLLREIAGVDYGGKINSSLNHVTFHIPPSYDRRVVMKRPVIWPSHLGTQIKEGPTNFNVQGHAVVISITGS